MNVDQITYLVFGVVLMLALLFDLGLLSKKDQDVTIKKALSQTAFWVGLALAFFFFVWYEKGQQTALEYLSAYLMEWSLSIDNIFVFILIFSAFAVAPKNYGRVLLIGILMAVVFRILFITIGVALVDRFHWVLYLFGVFLVYTGYKMFTATDEKEFDPQQSKIYQLLKKFLPLVPHDGGGKFMMRENGRPVYTTLFVVVIMLAVIDVVFALDSIPAVMGISRDKLVIYTSNVFAVLGLRSLFFLLRGAVSQFDYLPQGIAIVLVFIGLKMLGESWLNDWFDKTSLVMLSLGVIMLCIGGSIFYSIFIKKPGTPDKL
ncbi:MAG: TerC/Alx family metal homeostasis membrane protein [Bacteroidota bacterium]